MSSRSGIEAGRAFVRMFLDDAELNVKLKGVQAKLRATGASIKAIGAESVTMGAKILLPFVAALAVFIPFSDRMKEVQAVTQATTAEFERLNSQAKQLGSTTSFTAAQVAGAMAELGRAGFDTSQIEAAVEHTLNLARASGTELPRSAEIMASTMNQFNLTASDSQRIADTLTATVNGSAQGMEDLAEALKPVAPIAADAGANLEETAAAIGILANNGIKGSLAGNALGRAYKNLSSSDIRAQMERLGVAVVDSNGDLRSMTDIIGELGAATENMGTADRLAMFETLFGRGQAAALKLAGAVKSTAEQLKQLNSPAARQELERLGVSLTDDAGKAKELGAVFDEVRAATEGLSNQERSVTFETIGFDDLLTKIKLWDNAAAETAETMDSGIGGSFRRMMSAIEGLAISLAEAIEGPAEDFMAWVSGTAGAISEFVSQNRALIVLIAKIGVGLVAVGTAFLVTATAIKVVTLAVAAYRTVTKAAAVAQAALVALSGPKGWAVVAAGVAVATGAVVSLNAAMAEDVEAAKAAVAASEGLSDQSKKTQAALDALANTPAVDVKPKGVPELVSAREATEKLIVTMAGLRGETERALRMTAGGDALKTLDLLGGDVNQNAADRVRGMLKSAIPASEELKRKLIEVDAAFALLDRPVPEAIRGQLKLQLIDESTGAVGILRELQGEIAVLEGRATTAGMKMAEMLEAGVPPGMVRRMEQLTKIRDRLAEQKQQEDDANKERQQAEQKQLADQRSKAQQLKEQNQTADERFDIEISELENLRKAIDPETQSPLLDEDTYRRELERLHAEQTRQAGSDARLKTREQQFRRENSQDLRSVSGQRLIADILNGRGNLEERQLGATERILEIERRLLAIAENGNKKAKV